MLAQSSSAPQLHISVHARLFCLHVHRLEHSLTPHPHRTSSTTAVGAGDTRERTGTKERSASWAQPRVQGSGNSGWRTRSWFQILACIWALRMCWYQVPDVGGMLSMPCFAGWFLNRFHLSSVDVVATSFFVLKSRHKNFSHPDTTLSDGMSPVPRWASAVLTSAGDVQKTLKAAFLLFPRICPHVVNRQARGYLNN